MFTHLRSGVDMVRSGAIPRSDPYSFTAHGHPWVVQSWLAEWTYGILEEIGGLRLVVLEQGLLTALVALLVARLARSSSPWRSVAGGLISIGAGVALWSPRPLLFGLVCFALVVTIVERDKPVWLLVPVAWVWVNTHGSFVFGVLWLGAVVVGELFDSGRLPVARLRQLGVLVVGLVVGAVNPLGPKLLLFPLAVGDKSSVFRRVVEWRSPDFQSFEGLVTLTFLGIGLVVLLRTRTAWRDILPVVDFLALGLIAVRNLPTAAIVLAPALGRALRRRSVAEEHTAPGAGEQAGPGAGEQAAPADGDQATPVSPPVHPAFALAVGLLAVVFVVGAARHEPVRVTAYPDAAVTRLHDEGLMAASHRVASQDFVGNFLELRFGTKARVFVDDRADMYPVAVSDDYYDLLLGRPDSLGVLDRRAIDVVLWKDDRPLVGLLRLSPAWVEHAHDGTWITFVRR